MILKLRNLEFRFGRSLILSKVGFVVPEGAVVSLVGPNGSGKTTLLRCVVGALHPSGGGILIDGQPIGRMGSRELAKRIGYVPQMGVNGFPITVFDAVLLGRKPYLNWNPSPRDLELVTDILLALGLEKFALRDMSELSGGERQKVLIARAMASEPEMLILDEPTSSLDLRHQVETLDLVSRLAGQRRMSVIMAMHDLNLAAMFSDRLVLLKDGRVLGDAPPAELLTAKNIRSLYGVDVSVSCENGVPRVFLNRPQGTQTTLSGD